MNNFWAASGMMDVKSKKRKQERNKIENKNENL